MSAVPTATPIYWFGVIVKADYDADNGRPGTLHCYARTLSPDRARAIELGMNAARAAVAGVDGQVISEPVLVRAGHLAGHTKPVVGLPPGLVEFTMSRRGR